jgi:hypothetical protein
VAQGTEGLRSLDVRNFSRTQIIEGHWKILVDPARVSLDKSDMTIKTKNAVEIPLSVSPAVLLKVRQT